MRRGQPLNKEPKLYSGPLLYHNFQPVSTEDKVAILKWEVGPLSMHSLYCIICPGNESVLVYIGPITAT